MAQQLVQLTAWSYSRWTCYDQCPAKCKYANIDRIKEPSNAAMERGTAIHELAQKFTEGKLRAFPAELAKFKKQLLDVKKRYQPLCEQEWAFDKQWRQVGWFDSECWLRVKMDLHYLVTNGTKANQQTVLYVIDHKSGRVHPEHAMQRSLYALAGLLVYPDVSRVVAQHWYLDSGEVGTDDFAGDSLPALQKEWLARTKAMLSDKKFAPRPGNYCRWCHYRKANGGPCKF